MSLSVLPIYSFGVPLSVVTTALYITHARLQSPFSGNGHGLRQLHRAGVLGWEDRLSTDLLCAAIIDFKLGEQL